jgi:hypothetical protein
MDTVISIVELCVGLACLAPAVAMWPQRGVIRWVGVAIGAAGIVAIVYAVAALL